VQAAREAARSMQCSNNLKQLSLGVLVHEQAHTIFPDGGETQWAPPDQRTSIADLADRPAGTVPTVAPKQNWSWIYQITPYIEQQNVWQMSSIMQIMKTPIPVNSCPSRFGPRINNLPDVPWTGYRAMTDYAGNGGVDTTGIETGVRGMMGNGLDAPITRRPKEGTSDRGSSVRVADITDGTSNTLLAGEKCLNVGLTNQYQTDDDSGWTDGWDWDNIRWGYFQPHADWSDGSPSVANDGNDALHSAFGSSHNGFFNAALCDGSVRTISFNVSLDTFKMLSSRKDGKIIGGNAY
jgi:prepilin-type processing-associated H-X9-DG protein